MKFLLFYSILIMPQGSVENKDTMEKEENENKDALNFGDAETDPALPKDGVEPVKKDQISKVIGDVGRWQIEKILIVFLASAPGTQYSDNQSLIGAKCIKLFYRTFSYFPRKFHNSKAEVLVCSGS